MRSRIEVAAPDGPVTIEVPAGTQDGQRFRLRKRGVPRLGGEGRGDLWVEARIVVPPVTSERGRALLRELQGLLARDDEERDRDGGHEQGVAGGAARRS